MSRLVTVERGAALLDERMPGWEGRINLDTLDLSSPCRCILGQLHAKPNGTDAERYHRYNRGLDHLGLDDQEARRFGFRTWGKGKWWRLTQAWRELIKRRRAGAER